MEKAQVKMKAQYDQKSVDRQFEVGDQVLMLIPQQRQSSLSAGFCGPYPVIRKAGSRNYVISVPDGGKKTRLCHVNLLKEYVGRPLAQPVACAVRGSVAVEEDSVPVEAVSVRLENSAASGWRILLR